MFLFYYKSWTQNGTNNCISCSPNGDYVTNIIITHLNCLLSVTTRYWMYFCHSANYTHNSCKHVCMYIKCCAHTVQAFSFPFISRFVSTMHIRYCLFPTSVCVCVFLHPCQRWVRRTHLASMRAATSRCLSLIHGHWTASAAIPLPSFYITYLFSPLRSHHFPTSRQALQRVGRLLKKIRWPSFPSVSIHLLYKIPSGSSSGKLCLSFPRLLLSLIENQFYLKCFKPSVPLPWRSTCMQITTNFSFSVLFFSFLLLPLSIFITHYLVFSVFTHTTVK